MNRESGIGGIGNRESGIGNRESGIGNWESGIGNRESGEIISDISLTKFSSNISFFCYTWDQHISRRKTLIVDIINLVVTPTSQVCK